MSTCPFHTIACGLSVPCNRCRAATSQRNHSIMRTGHARLRRPNSFWVGKSGR